MTRGFSYSLICRPLGPGENSVKKIGQIKLRRSRANYELTHSAEVHVFLGFQTESNIEGAEEA